MPDSRPETHRDGVPDPVDPPVSVSHLVHTLGAYKHAILISLLAVALAYAICAIAYYLFAPRQRIVSLPFRLEFEGAETGQYPNGLKFSSADIVSTPVLRKVHDANNLGKYFSFDAFTRAVVVVEANPAFESLQRRYQARLADQRLTPIDRQRIEEEFDAQRASLAKNQHAIQFLVFEETKDVPQAVINKVLLDTLSTWANEALNEQRVTQFRVSVLTPTFVQLGAYEADEPLIALRVLRSKISRIFEYIFEMRRLPGITQARTKSDSVTLLELRVRLEEILRFRLEPMIGLVSSRGMIRDRQRTIRFLEEQLAFDQRALANTTEQAEVYRRALAAYLSDSAIAGPSPAAVAAGTQGGTGETVMPQLNESFLDRLIAMSGRANDASYRQSLVTDYREASQNAIPYQQEVAYDTQVLQEVRNAGSGATAADAELVRNEISRLQADLEVLVGKINEIYKTTSDNLNPATQLYTRTAVATTHDERSVSLFRLALIGVLVLLIALPVIIIACLIHNRVREEDALA